MRPSRLEAIWKRPGRFSRSIALGRLNDDAGRLVRAHVLDPIEEREHGAELLIAQTTYSAALAQLGAE